MVSILSAKTPGVDFLLAFALFLGSRKGLPRPWLRFLVPALTLLTSGCLIYQFYGFLRFARRY